MITKLVSYFSEELYIIFKEYVVTGNIEFKNEAFEDTYTEGSVRLKIIARGKGIDSEEFKNEREKRRKRLSDLVKYDVAR